MPQDEFELLLERCGERLAEINLSLPALEDGAPRPQVYTLAPAPPPRPEPAPARAQTAPAEKEPDETPEDDVFPPPLVIPRTPPPAAPRAQPTTAPQAARFTSRRAVYAAAAIVAAGACWSWRARRSASDLEIDVDGADAMAVRPEKGDLMVAEGTELVALNRDGRELERRQLDAPVASLRWAQGSLWSADGVSRAITERTKGGRSTVFTLNHVPGALFVKDKYLWTSEKNGNTIRQFLITRAILGAMLQPLDSYALPGLSPETFAMDDAKTLWLVDSASRRLFRLRVENGSYRPVDSAPLSPFVGPEGRLHGLTIEDDAVWIMVRRAKGGRALLRRIAKSRLDWTRA